MNEKQLEVYLEDKTDLESIVAKILYYERHRIDLGLPEKIKDSCDRIMQTREFQETGL